MLSSGGVRIRLCHVAFRIARARQQGEGPGLVVVLSSGAPGSPSGIRDAPRSVLILSLSWCSRTASKHRSSPGCGVIPSKVVSFPRPASALDTFHLSLSVNPCWPGILLACWLHAHLVGEVGCVQNMYANQRDWDPILPGAEHLPQGVLNVVSSC